MNSRLVFLHGFTQTHHHWHACASLIGARLGSPTLAFVDLPGHGLSTDDHTPIEAAGAAIAELAGAGTYIGYSMGARHALFAARARPDRVERMVLIGGTPGLRNADERAARVADDERRAEHVMEIGVDAFVDEWLSAPMFASMPHHHGDIDARRTNTSAGLAASLRVSGTGAQPSLWDELATIAPPTLVLAGELDAKFAAIGSEMASSMPNATFAVVPGAGHATVAEQPGAVADLVANWLICQWDRPVGLTQREPDG